VAQQSSIFGPVFPTEAEPPAPAPSAPGGPLQLPPSSIFGGPATDEQLAQRVGEARTASPDTAARIWTLQQKTGLPGPVIADHLDEIEREVAQRNFDAAKFRRESPHLAAWLQEDEQQAAIANDDLANLGLLEWLVTAPQRAFARGQAQVELSQLRTRMLFGTPLTAAEHRRLAELKTAMGAGGELGVGDAWFRKAVTGTSELLPILWGGTLKGAERAAIAGPTAGTMAAIGAPLTGPATIFTVPAMTGGGVAAGFLAGGVEFGFQLEAGLAYDEFLDVKDELGHTIDPEVARVAAIGVGVVNSALEAYGLGKLAALLPGGKQVVAAFARPAVKAALRSPTVRAALAKAAKAYTGNLTLETAVELVQELSTILGGEAAKAASGVEGATGEEVAGRLSETAVQSALSFTLLSAVGPAAGVRGDLRAARQAEHNQTFFTALGEGVAQSKTAGRSPDAVQSFLAKATKDGPLADVYAPVESWTTYWQSQNLDPAEMATEVTGDSEAYARAVREGTDLVIPTARYAAKLAGTEHNAFFAQELRTDPNAPNFREAKAIRAAVEARMKAAAAEAEQTPDASAARQALLTQLEAKGLAPDEAARVADLHGSIVGAIGERAGRPEAELVADYPIAVTRPGFEGFETTEPMGGIPPSTAPATETPEQRGARRAGHYAALTRSIVRDAVAQDPNVDVEALQDQIAFRLAMHEAGQESLAASGEDPGNLLRAVAAEGGLWWDPRTEGERGEVEDLMARGVDSRQRASVLDPRTGKRRVVGAQTWRGVAGVFKEGGKSPDAMLEALRQDPRFEHLTDFHDLFDALGRALSERAVQVDPNRFPGTEDLASQLGIRLGERWWEQTGRRRTATAEDVAAGEAGEVGDAVETGEGDTSFDFSQGAVEDPALVAARAAREEARAKVDQVVEAIDRDTRASHVGQMWGGPAPQAASLGELEGNEAYRTARDAYKSADARVQRLEREARRAARRPRPAAAAAPDAATTARATEIREAIRSAPPSADTELAQSPGPKRAIPQAAIDALETIRKHGFDVELYDDEERVWLLSDATPSDRGRGFGRQRERRPPAAAVKALAVINTLPEQDVIRLITGDTAGETELAQGPADAALAVEDVAALDAMVPKVAEAGQFPRRRDLKLRMQELVQQAAKDAGITLDASTPEGQAYLTSIALRDVLTALEANSNAVGWYDEKTRQALAVAALIYPELNTDENARFAFTYALAVFSNGVAVEKNFQLADDAYAKYRRTGKMPTNTGIGTAKKQMRVATELFNEKVAQWGLPTFRQFMVSQFTVSELRRLGLDASGEAAETEVRGAAVIGPKVGNGFFSNLNGFFDALTMDRWLLRTWGRWTGQLFYDTTVLVPAGRTRLEAALARMLAQAPAQARVFSDIVDMDLAAITTDEQFDTLAQDIRKASEKPALRDRMSATAIGDEVRRAGNNLGAHLDGQKETPENPVERAQIRAVFSEVLAQLHQVGYAGMTIADLQALLWYAERRLYDAGTSEEDVSAGYEDLEAPDYANAASNLARSKGISDAAINGAVAGETARRGQPAQRPGTGGRGPGAAQAAQHGAGTAGQAARRGFTPAEREAFLARYAKPPHRRAVHLTPTLEREARATLEYAQGRKGTRGQRGFIKFAGGRGPRRFEIGLLKTADPSTLLHELGHFYLEVLGDLADGLAAQDPATLSDTQQRLVADYQAFLQFLGVESRDAITTEHHEKFARAFEAYLYEGKAPSVELRSAFASFAAWLTRVYRSIRALDVELSPEVRQLFDRLAATDEAIAAAQSEAEVSPLFTDAESAGMTELEFAAYQDEVREAHDREHEIVRTKVLADLKRADQAWWTKAKDAMTATVTAELQQDPVYRAMSVMRTGAYPDGTPFVEGEDPPVPIKLSRASLVAHYGKDILARLPRPYLYAKDSGITADAAAENFWFSSGDELLKAIIEAVPFGEMVAREVDRRMTAEYGDIFTDGRLEAEAAAIVQGGEHRQRIVQAELKALTKGLARSTIPSAAVLNEAARRQVAATKIRDLRPGLHLQAARRASKQAFELMATGQDRAGAVRAKLQELINLALYREARDTLERVESMRRTMRGYRSTTARQRFGKAGADYLTQIDALLDRYELARVTQKELAGRVTLAAFVDAQQKADIPIEIPQTLLNEARRINYLDVPVGEFTDVYDAVEHLARLSRLKNELLKAAKRRTFEEARDTLVGSILLHNDKQPTKVEFRPEDERRDFINDTFASHTKLAIHARALDGFEDGGEMWEQIIRPINEAGDAEAVMREDAITRMAALFKQAYPGLELGRLNRKLFIKEIGTSLSKEGRLLVALNWGNEDNRQRLLNDPKRQWNAAQIQAILETLDRRDWEFVQGVWDYVDSFWPAIEAKQKRVVGLAPEKVVATPVDTKFGQFRGGYFPINYDGRLVARAGVLKETGEATLKTFAAYVSATTRRGHTQARIDNVKMAVRLDFSVLFNHVDQVIHDLTHHEMLIDVNRLLEDRDVQAAIVDTRGHQVYRQFVNGLEDIAMGAAPAKNWGERAANFARGGTQVALLGLNFWTALQQPLGLFNGMFQVGPKWVIRGMKRWLRDAATMQSTLQWIHTKSAFMKDRATGGATQDLQDLRATLSRPNSYFDVLVRTATKDKVTQQNILNSFLWHITQAQKIADVPTWIGAYEKHMAQGDQTLSVEALEARAVALADQAVRDAQGSGRISDLAQVQRGGPIFKLFMTFYSYGNVLFNQTVEAYGRTEPSLKRPGNAAAFIGHLSLLYAFPALGLVVMSRALGRSGGEDDDEPVVVEFGKEMLSAALNTMIVVREFGGLLQEGVRGYAGPAGTRIFQQGYALVRQIEQGEVDEGLVGAATNVAGIIFRFPATQVQRTVEGFMALQEGRTRNPAALLVGPPRD
jgi:hypothetical protein